MQDHGGPGPLGPSSGPDGFTSDRQNIYDQAVAQLAPDELRRFTRALAKALEVATVPEQIVTMHGLGHAAACNGDHYVASAFRAMAHATAIDYTTELEVADFSAALDAGMPPETP